MTFTEIIALAKKIKLSKGLTWYETPCRAVYDKNRSMFIDNRTLAPDVNAVTTNNVVECNKCKETLCFMVITEGDKFKVYEFIYTSQLLAYRVRPDYLIGLQCLCGNDTRLSLHKKDNRASDNLKLQLKDRLKALGNEEVQTMVEKMRTNNEQTHWNSKDSIFVIKEIK